MTMKNSNACRYLLSSLIALFLFSITVHADTAKAQANADKVQVAIVALEKLTRKAMGYINMPPSSYERKGIPAIAIGIVYQDKVSYIKEGILEAGKTDLVNEDTVFQLASISKPLGSTVIAELVSQKKLAWDDLVTRYEPAFALNDAYVTSHVTIGDMYAHRSGLPDHAGDLLEDMGYDRAQVLERLRYIPLENRFRAKYEYTNFGVTAGAVAAANAVGKSWEEVSDTFYKKLGMTRTSSRYDDFINNPNHASGHILINGKWVFKEQRQPDAQSPAGGASSSVRDMAQWLRLHLAQGKLNGSEIISSAALNETYTPQMVSRTPENSLMQRAGFYGLGWGVNYDDLGRVRLSHSGAFTMGAATTVVMLPAEQLGIVVLTNGSPIGVPEALAETFIHLATYGKVPCEMYGQKEPCDLFTLFHEKMDSMNHEGYSKTDYSKPLTHVAPAHAPDRYAGTYSNDFVGAIEIINQNGQLKMVQGPAKHTFMLTHYDGDVFFYQTQGESQVGLSGVRFTVDANGKAINMWVENLDAYKMGNFVRQ
jgi:CubicO group peptidase (beta-lactamase class C family)